MFINCDNSVTMIYKGGKDKVKGRKERKIGQRTTWLEEETLIDQDLVYTGSQVENYTYLEEERYFQVTIYPGWEITENFIMLFGNQSRIDIQDVTQYLTTVTI